MSVATITVRGLDDAVRDKLRLRAAENGRSMEAEVRELLSAVVAAEPDPPASTLAELAERVRLATGGGVDLPIPDRLRSRQLPFTDESWQ